MSNIRECFTSRFEDGLLIEVDYDQLEIVALATLADDKQLAEDLKSGIDMHKLRASEWLKKPVEDINDLERFQAKRMSFMLQYGSGAPNMARQLGLPTEECQDFIDAFYDRYPAVAQWQQKVEMDALVSRIVDGHTKSGLPRGRGEFLSITNRVYTFYETDHPYKKNETGFNPPEIKNYPVQGFATGDIMKIALAELHKGLWYRENVLLINTVHDSIMLDCEDEYFLPEICEIITYSMTTATESELNNRYKIELVVPLSVDIKAGYCWADMKSVDKLSEE